MRNIYKRNLSNSDKQRSLQTPIMRSRNKNAFSNNPKFEEGHLASNYFY